MNYEGILDNIIELAGHRLNEWEQGFVDNIYMKYHGKMDKLSDKQKETLRRIQNKYLKY